MSVDPSGLLPLSEPIQRLFKGHKAWVATVAFSPNGQWLASGSRDGTIKLWDPLTAKCVRTLQGHKYFVDSLSFSPSSLFLVACYHDGTVELWDLIKHGWLKNLRARKWKIKKDTHSSSHLRCIRYSPDKTKIAFTGAEGGVFYLLNSATGRQCVAFHKHDRTVSSLAFTPDGKRLISGSYDGYISLWDIKTESLLKKRRLHEEKITTIALSPDGKRLATGSHDKSIRIWELESGERLMTLTGHSMDVRSVVFSPDGRWIISGGGDNRIIFWNAETGEQTRVYKDLRSLIGSLFFSQTGRFLAFNTFIPDLAKSYARYRETDEDRYAFALLDFGNQNLGCVHPLEALLTSL